MAALPCPTPATCGVSSHEPGSQAHRECAGRRQHAPRSATSLPSATATLPRPSGVMERVRVHVPEGTVPDRERAYGVHAPNGAPVRGCGIAYDDARIPETVYHVTTQRDAVRASGMLLAGGVGGLGGDGRDQIVSLTVSRDVAEDLGYQMRMVSELANGYEEHGDPGEKGRENIRLADVLNSQAEVEGWRFTYTDRLRDVPVMRESYGFRDILNQFYNERESRTGNPNPLFFSSLDELRLIDPRQVEVLHIPRECLNNGAQIMDFDLGQGGLEEVRSYGDVPLTV